MIRKVLLFGMFVFLCNGVLGIEGVSPGSYEVDFEAGLEREFVFDFVVDGKEKLNVEGDLAGYVELDKIYVEGRESVVASLKFSESIEGFGVSNIRILAGNVVGIIKVKVPYPDRYIGLELAVPDVNVGDEIPINLKVSNLGKEGLNVSPVVEVFFEDKIVKVFEGEERFVDVVGEEGYGFFLNSVNYSAGDYLVIVKVDYDGEIFEEQDFFRLGELGVRILNYTREVKGGGVRELEIEVESLYDDEISGVYAEVRIVRGGDFEGFDSSVVSLGGWEKKMLVGYFDTRGLEGEVLLNVDVYYDGGVESKMIGVYIGKGFNLVFWSVGILLLLLLGAFGWKVFGKSK